MRFVYSILSLLLAAGFVRANELTIHREPPHICATPNLKPTDFREFVSDLQANHPERYLTFLDAEQTLRSFNALHTQQRMFWARNFTNDQFYRVTATLRKENNGIRIWVEDDSWNNDYVTQQEVDKIYEALTIQTPGGSINPEVGIVDIDTSLFGQPPNRAGDDYINFLILDIIDDYNPDEANSPFVAGYFDPTDQTNSGNSNQMDLLYIDASPGIFSNGHRRTNSVLGTTAHEFQHLIHHNYDPAEEIWVNEGLSELATILCGYGIGFPSRFLHDPNRKLTGWSSDLEDYSRVGLWTLYLYEQFDLEFINRLTQHPTHGIEGLNTVFNQLGFTVRFNQVFAAWAIANFVNDVTLDSRFGYRHPAAQNLQVSLTEDVAEYPKLVEGNIAKYAAQYFRFRGADTLEIEFFTSLNNGYLVRRSSPATDIIPLIDNPFRYPDFNVEEQFVLILPNQINNGTFEFCAYAPFSLAVLEKAYDDGQINFSVSTQGIAANKFEFPGEDFNLSGIRFFNPQSHTPLKIHIYDSRNGLPGNSLVQPLDTLIFSGDSWIEIGVAEEVNAQIENEEEIFIGLEIDEPHFTFAYDHDRQNRNSYFYRADLDGWQSLSDLKTSDGTKLTGSWMIRANFEGGLTPSGEKGCEILSEEVFTVARVYPNPSLGSVSVRLNIVAAGELKLSLYDVLGRKVAQITQFFTGANKSSDVQWNDIRTLYGKRLSSGIYFLKAEFRNFETQKTEASDVLKLVMVK